MYWIYIETRFQASHQLTFSNGSKEPLHTHPWRVVAGVCAETLNREGLVMDFLELGKVLESAIKPLAGKQLETLACFSGRNASAEAVARYVFDAVAPEIAPPVRLDSIEVTEAEGCRARYQPGA
jgi:6-pyruvoyltetrahydropterin/6-carboxytetrahydropterin synthase